MLEQIFDIINRSWEYGLFAVLFVISFLFVIFLIWKIGLRISEQAIVTMSSIASSNEAFAKSSEKMNELLQNILEQDTHTIKELEEINYHIAQNKYINKEIIEILKIINEDMEIKIRLDNIKKEICREKK